MKFANLFAAAFASSSLAAATPVIPEDGVSMVQDPGSRLVTITYNLSSGPAIVTLDIQTNGVSIGFEKFRNLGGAVNKKVEAGTHTITWRPEIEWDSSPLRPTH